MTTLHEDRMLTGKAARAMRGACCFGVLALAAVALSACMSEEDRAAQARATQANVALNIERMEAAAAPFERLCSEFMTRGDLYGYVEDAAARAKAMGAPAPKPFGQHEPRENTANIMGWIIEGAEMDVPEGHVLEVGGILHSPIFEQDPLTMQNKFVSQDPVPFLLTCRLGFAVARPLDRAQEQALEDRGAVLAQQASDAFVARSGGEKVTSISTTLAKWDGIQDGAPVDLGGTLHQFWGPVFKPRVARVGGLRIDLPPEKDAGFVMNSGAVSLGGAIAEPMLIR